MSGLPDTIFKRDKRGRERLVSHPSEALVAVGEATKLAILQMLSTGATVTEIASSVGMPNYSTIWDARKKDPAFDQACRDAQAQGAEIMLARAQEHAIEEIETRDPDRVRCALMMMDITQRYAEKIAPREFGPLVKLGSDPNAPLTLNVVSFAVPAAIPLTPVDWTNDQTDARAVLPQHAPQAHEHGAEESRTDQG